MTREEAVARIKDHIEIHRYNERNAVKIFEALDMAIKALEQPEPNYDEWCTDCKEYDTDRHCCPRWNKVIRQTLADVHPKPCEDAVSREAVIDVFYELWGTSLTRTVNAINDLPPVTPKQRTGKWIPKDGRYYCGRCNGIAPKGIRWEFCPHCGVKMVG